MDVKNIEKNSDARIDYAMAALKNENNKMGLYCALLGIGQFKLEVIPGAGHNYYSILDAIYRRYKIHPEEKIDVFLHETFLKFAQSVSSLEGCAKYINIISAQLENQKNNISPFEIEVKDVLLAIKHSITQRSLNSNQQFMKKISEYDEYFNQNYGCKIL